MRRVCLLLVLSVLSSVAYSAPSPYGIVTASYLGDTGCDDAVVGAKIQSDGTLVVAANLGPSAQAKLGIEKGEGNGCMLLLNPEGTKVKAGRCVAQTVSDLALDGKDRLYVAANESGVIVLSPTLEETLWRNDVSGCSRLGPGR